MFSSRSVQIAALFSDVFGQALPNLCRSFYNETKAEMFFSVFAVALLTEGVDRNTQMPPVNDQQPRVALLTEGVDRNLPLPVVSDVPVVALLTEGVDRNVIDKLAQDWDTLSPSSRRAWIEIRSTVRSCKTSEVALLTEGVDRNVYLHAQALVFCGRPPHGGRG